MSAAAAVDVKSTLVAAPVAGTAVQSTQLFINNQFVNPKSGAYVDVFDPSTGSVIARCANAGKADVDAAVAAARLAFDTEGGWSETTGTQRAVYLRALATKIAAAKPALAALETLNSGKPLTESLWDLDDVSGCFNYYAGLAEELDAKQGSEIKLTDARFKSELRWEATGVAGCIIPWNYPLLMLAWKVAPALAAGCTVVLKPSELTPLTAIEFAKLTVEVKLPAGVFNLITGLGPNAGAPLCSHPGVDKIAFTGSVPTGTLVAGLGAKLVKPVTLELGGKSPIVVFDDVDIDKAVEWIMFGVFWTNGQICSSTSRLLVHEAVAPKLLARLIEETGRIHIGNPNAKENSEKTGMLGPVVSIGQLNKISAMVEQSVKEGGKVLTGGRKPAATNTAGGVSKGGYFYEPTVIAVDAKNSIWINEVFGPVLSVVTFRDEKDAIRLANDTEFGLAGAVLTKDNARAQRVARRLRAGITWINCSQPCFVEAPWGGLKRSGVGRELGAFGLHNYLQPKQVTSYVTGDDWGWYIKPAPSKL